MRRPHLVPIVAVSMQQSKFLGGQHGFVSSAVRLRRVEQQNPALAKELAPLRKDALEGHPWRDWAEAHDSYQLVPEEILEVERHHARELGGKWTMA